MKERPAYEGSVDTATRRMGIAAVVVLGAIIAIVMVVMAFSTANTPMSVDGDENVRSQWIESSD